MLAPETDQGNDRMGDSPKLLALPPRNVKKHLLASTPTQEAIMDRREKAFDMRIGGATYRTIAAKLGVSIATIHDDLKSIAKLKYKGLIEKDELLLLEQNAYYDALLERWLPLALSDDLNVGEVRQNRRGEDYDVQLSAWEASAAATDKVLKIIEGKAKIGGLIGGPGKGTDRTPEEVGTSVALSVMSAIQTLRNRDKPLEAEIIS